MATGLLSPPPVLTGVIAGGSVTLTYKNQEPTNNYEIINLQFGTAPVDSSDANVYLNKQLTGTLSGAASFGPLMVQMGDVVEVTLGAPAGDDGDTVTVVVTGYWTDERPDPPPVPISGSGSPPTSTGGPPSNINATIVSPLDTEGQVRVSEPQAGTAGLYNVNGANVSTSLRPALAGRKGLLVVNDQGVDTATLYLAYAGAASTTAYTVQIPPNGYWEMPAPIYTKAIFGIWSAASGAARITELS